MGNKSAFRFIREQSATVPPVETSDLTGRTVLIVGANQGIGFETAKHFALMGAEKVFMACRSKERGEEAVRRLKESTGYGRAELWIVDLASFASVKAFADKFNREVEKLDILVANAAIIPVKYEETEDGWETSLQVNHIAPALLILLLLPKLFRAAELSPSAAPSPRIVIVASEVHQYASVPKKVFEAPSALEAISSKELSIPYDDFKKYNLAKLLNVCFTRALTAHLPHTPSAPIVASVNPGFCQSNIRSGMNSPSGRRPFMIWVMETLLAWTAEEGSRQVIFASIATPKGSTKAKAAAAEKEGEEKMRGAYVSFAAVEEPGDFVISEKGKKFEDILWTDTLRVLSKLDDRVQPIVDKYLMH